MIAGTLIRRNLARNRLRTGLTVLSVALSLFLFTLLRGVVSAMERVADDSSAQLRLVVHHKTTMTQLLPLHVGKRIGSIAGVRAVCGVRWFGGRLEDSNEQFPSLAAETATFPIVYSDFNLRDEELDAWRRERTAAVIGSGLAARLGWQRGQRVTLRSTVPPYLPLEFRIIGITESVAYQNVLAFRLEFLLDELRAAPETTAEYADAVNFYWVKAQPDTPLVALAERIDSALAATPDATRTQLEAAFVAGFAKMFGDIPRSLAALGLVVVATSLLVLSSTMLMSVRERTAELAVLKVLGFRPHQLAWMVLVESSLIGLAGGAIGSLPALAALAYVGSGGLTIPYFPSVSLSPATAAVGILAGTACGALAGVLPVFQIARLSTAAALRHT